MGLCIERRLESCPVQSSQQWSPQRRVHLLFERTLEAMRAAIPFRSHLCTTHISKLSIIANMCYQLNPK